MKKINKNIQLILKKKTNTHHLIIKELKCYECDEEFKQ